MSKLWFSRFRSSCEYWLHRTIHGVPPPHKNAPAPATTNVFNSHRNRTWSTSSFFPLALAFSAGSLALQPHPDPSFCDAPDDANNNRCLSLLFLCQSLLISFDNFIAFSMVLTFINYDTSLIFHLDYKSS